MFEIDEAEMLERDEVANTAALEPDGFIDPVAMENDPDEFFAGDRGVLAPEVRRVLVRLLHKRFVSADSKEDWSVLVDNQQVIESRLHDLFVRLIVDFERGVAYKQQVRSEELEIPVLLRDDSYNRAETLVLVYLRTVYQRQSTAGEDSVRVDIEEVMHTVLSYFTETDGNLGARQKAVKRAVDRLGTEGIVQEESEGRYRVTPLIEIVLSADRLRELQEWLREQVEALQEYAGTGTQGDTSEPEGNTHEPEADSPESEGDISGLRGGAA